MAKYHLVEKRLLIEKSAKDVTNALANSFGAFTADIKYSLSSLDKELFTLKLTHQVKFKILDSYVTIAINNTNQNHMQTELELLLCYKSGKNLFMAWFQKIKIRWAINNLLLDFKNRCEKWL